MRSILNISVPQKVKEDIEIAVKEGGFATKSEFIRDLIRMWNTHKLAEELKAERKKFEAGKGKILRSLKDLE